MGEGLAIHQSEFRLLSEVLEKNIYASRVSCGDTHMLLYEDLMLTQALDTFIRFDPLNLYEKVFTTCD